MIASLEISFCPLSDGLFPDVRQWPVSEWLTLADAKTAGGHIVIDGRAEYRSRTGGKDAPSSERIGWRTYFEWLGACEGSNLPWNLLRDACETRLRDLFGFPKPEPSESAADRAIDEAHRAAEKAEKPVPTSVAAPAQPRSHGQQSPAAREAREYYDGLRTCLPNTIIPNGPTFEELYVVVDYGRNRETLRKAGGQP